VLRLVILTASVFLDIVLKTDGQIDELQ